MNNRLLLKAWGAVILFAVFSCVAPSANALGYMWQTSGDNTYANFGSNASQSTSKVAEGITIPTSTVVCKVYAKVYWSGGATRGSYMDLNIYEVPFAVAMPDGGTGGVLVATSTLNESLLGTDNSTATPFHEFDLSSCVYLYAGKSYGFVFSRRTETSSQVYGFRARTTSQYSYSDYYVLINGYSWQKNIGTKEELMIKLYGYAGLDDVPEGVIVDGGQVDTAEWEAKLQDIESRVPFGYMYLIADAWNDIDYSTSTPFAISYQIEGRDPVSVDIGQIVDDAPDGVKDMSNTAISFIVWISVLAYIAQRVFYFKESAPI